MTRRELIDSLNELDDRMHRAVDFGGPASQGELQQLGAQRARTLAELAELDKAEEEK